MIIPVIYPSAAEFWLDGTFRKNIDYFEKSKRIFANLPQSFDFSPDHKTFSEIASQTHLDLPLYVYAPDPAARRNSSCAMCSVRPVNLPENCFIKAGTIRSEALSVVNHSNRISIYIASPELCFLQAGRILTVPRLIELGNNLCAKYIRDNAQKYDQRKRAIITCRDDIMDFLNNISKYKGIKNARLASQYILDNSNSPMESSLAVITVLPITYGGYSLKAPTLNGQILLPAELRSYMGYDRLTGDMVWYEEKVIVEYDSNTSHLNASQAAFDKKRAAAFMQAGYTVITLTPDDLKSLASLDKAFRVIRSSLGLKNVDHDLTRNINKRSDVFHSLFRK